MVKLVCKLLFRGSSMVEQLPVKQLVGGSSPPRGARWVLLCEIMNSVTTRFTICPDGDFYEQYYWRYLADKFPNYEVFWSNYIAPLTNRPQNINPKSGVDRFIQKIWASHYTLFVGLGSAFRVKSGIPDELSLSFYFETIFYHLGVSLNQQEEFFFLLFCLANKTIGEDYKFPKSFAKEEFVSKAETYYQKHYLDDYGSFKEFGKSISVIFHSRNDLVSQFVQLAFNKEGQKLHKSFARVKEKIRAYRNFLQHSQQIGKKLTEEGVLVPKYNKLKQYGDWFSVRASGLKNEDFVNLETLCTRLLKDYSETLNKIWEHVIAFYCIIEKKKSYKRMSGQL